MLIFCEQPSTLLIILASIYCKYSWTPTDIALYPSSTSLPCLSCSVSLLLSDLQPVYPLSDLQPVYLLSVLQPAIFFCMQPVPPRL